MLGITHGLVETKKLGGDEGAGPVLSDESSGCAIYGNLEDGIEELEVSAL